MADFYKMEKLCNDTNDELALPELRVKYLGCVNSEPHRWMNPGRIRVIGVSYTWSKKYGISCNIDFDVLPTEDTTSSRIDFNTIFRE